MRNREAAVVNLSLLAVTPNEVVFIVKEERLVCFFLMVLEIHVFNNQFCDLLYQINDHTLLKINFLCWPIWYDEELLITQNSGNVFFILLKRSSHKEN